MRTLTGRLYVGRTCTFNELLSLPAFDPKTAEAPVPATLMLGPDPVGTAGSFKQAYTGRICSLSGAPFPDAVPFTSGAEVCAKRAIKSVRGSKIELLDDASSLSVLAREMRALEYGAALTKLGYSFIDRELQKADDPPPHIYRLSYVNFALFIAEPTSNGGKRGSNGVFLIEDLLNVNTFEKYLTNSSVVPLEEDRSDFTEFLNFIQHVQWAKTGGGMFVSDFQGTTRRSLTPVLLAYEYCMAQATSSLIPWC